MIRPESLQIFPASDKKLFHAATSSLWLQLAQYSSIHTPPIGGCLDLASNRTHPTALQELLILLQHQIYEANYRLVTSDEVHNTDQLLEPWRLYMGEAKDALLLSRLITLPSTSASLLDRADINGILSWHMSCMMTTANMRLFEEAAGKAGSAAVSIALSHISSWSCTATARRAVLHAAQVFKVLFHRRVSDVINVHAVATLFKSALILSFYLLTAPASPQNTPDTTLELFDEIDWARMGNYGLTEVKDISTDTSSLTENHALRFILEGCPFSVVGIVHPPGYSSCGRVLLHAADLMQTLGKWKSRTFSQILHLLTDDLMDIDTADGGEAN